MRFLRTITATALVAGLALSVAACGLVRLNKPVATITYQLVPDSGHAVTSADLDAALRVLQDRVSAAAYSGIVVRAAPPDRVQIGVTDVIQRAAIESLAGPTGVVEFVLLPAETYGISTSAGLQHVPEPGQLLDPSLPAQFNGSQLDPSRVRAAYDEAQGAWVVDFGFKVSAVGEFETWTGQHVGEYLAIALDRKVVSTPTLESKITGGQGVIAGDFTATSAKTLAGIMAGGALPIPVTEVSFESGW